MQFGFCFLFRTEPTGGWLTGDIGCPEEGQFLCVPVVFSEVPSPGAAMCGQEMMYVVRFCQCAMRYQPAVNPVSTTAKTNIFPSFLLGDFKTSASRKSVKRVEVLFLTGYRMDRVWV